MKTNYFKLEFDNKKEWFQYLVEITSAVKKKKFDENKKYTGFDVVPKPKRDKPIDFSRGSELSRRILKKLCKDLQGEGEGKLFASDGKGTAYAPKKLFEGESFIYQVVVPRDCDEDETDADLIQKEWFLVKFTEVAMIYPTSNIETVEHTRQAMDIILKSALHSIGMKAFGRNPRAFHFPEDRQEMVVNSNLLQRMLRNVRLLFFSNSSMFTKAFFGLLTSMLLLHLLLLTIGARFHAFVGAFPGCPLLRRWQCVCEL